MQPILRSLSRVIDSIGGREQRCGGHFARLDCGRYLRARSVHCWGDFEPINHMLPPEVLEELRVGAIRKCLKVSISCILQLPRL